jgi:S1-C subfamily serine protease
MAGQTNVQDLRRATLAKQGYDPEPMIKACVKVFVTQVQPSYALPWARGEEARSTGSGFVVMLPPEVDMAGGLPGTLHPDAAPAAPNARVIVTNAHVVENYSLIQVRCAGSADKYVARVLCIGHDVDLALLLVHDDAFWEVGPPPLAPPSPEPHHPDWTRAAVWDVRPPPPPEAPL